MGEGKLQHFEMQFHHKFIIYMQKKNCFIGDLGFAGKFLHLFPIRSKYSEGLNLKFILYTFGTQKQHD